MSQQGTPLGLTTPLNQARMSAGTFSCWPLSNACAALTSIAATVTTTIQQRARMWFSSWVVSRAASHRLLRSSLQQFLQLLLVEFCAAGREVAARLGAGRDQVKPAVLHPLHRSVGDAGFGRVALVIGGIDRE